MKNNIMGFVLLMLGITIGLVLSVAIRNEAKQKCELNLPRTEQCVLTWVPKIKETK